MKNSSKVIIYGVAAAFLTVLGTLLRTVGLFKFYDRGIGYFQSGAIVPQLLKCLCIIAPVIFAFAGLFASKVKIEQSGGFASKVGSAVAAVMIFVHAVYLVPYCLSYVEGSLLIPGLFLAFAILSVLYFATGVAKKSGAENRALLGFGVILYATAGLAKSYFDFTTTMNSPDKLLLQVAYMTVMLYMLAETGLLIGAKKSGRFAVFSFIAFFFCTVSSVPALAAYLSRGFYGFLATPEYAMSQLGVLALAVFALCRFIDCLRGAEDYTLDELDAIKEEKKAENEKK